MKRVTKNQIDQLASLKVAADLATKQANKAKKLYEAALTPVLEYLDESLKLKPLQKAELRGNRSEVDFGPCRKNRKIKDMVEALRRLEAVRQGLGFEHISIPLKVLDEELRSEELDDLVRIEYGGRSVKATIFEEEG